MESTPRSSEMSNFCAWARSSSGTPMWAWTSRSTMRMRSDMVEQGAGGAVEVEFHRVVEREPAVGFGFVVEDDGGAERGGGVVEEEEVGLLVELGRLDAVLHDLEADVA